MKVLQIFLLLLFLVNVSFAQDLHGTIKDKNLGDYLSGITIKSSSYTTYSDNYGRFALPNIHVGDTITFYSIGFNKVEHIVYNVNPNDLVIYMEPRSILLDEVRIIGFRNYKTDSLRFREEFAKAFNYNKPKFKDIFISKNYSSNIPKPYYQANNSTASIVSINVLSVISLLGKNKAPQSKLQQMLLKEEEDRYLDNSFSKHTIQQLTGLKGDSLQTFIRQYRPSADSVRNMSEYEIMMYIKSNYLKYIDK